MKKEKSVAVGQPLFVVETDKAAVEVPAEQAGTLLKILVPAGETVPVSTAVAWIGTPGEAMPEAKEALGPSRARGRSVRPRPLPRPQQTPVVPKRTVEVAASPVAKRLARELGVDLADVQATSRAEAHPRGGRAGLCRSPKGRASYRASPGGRPRVRATGTHAAAADHGHPPDPGRGNPPVGGCLPGGPVRT